MLAAAAVGATELDDIEQRGKQIFMRGTSPAGSPISALLGIDQTELPASAVPCASCHGIDGRGRPEGGVIPSDITWSELSKNYGHAHDYGRRHPAFDDTSVAAAISVGTDPAGNVLDVAMPRYRMKQDDLDALIAYLKRVEYESDPGVGERSVQLATLLPSSGPAAPQGAAIRAVLTAFVQQLNSGGGINGRSIDLRVIALGETPAETVANVEDALASQDIFALIAIYSQGVEIELMSLFDRYDVPVIGPITRTPDLELRSSSNVFYLYGGTVELIDVLANFTTGDNADESRRRIVIAANTELLRTLERRVIREEQADTLLPYGEAAFDAAATAAKITDEDDVFFLGTPPELEQLIGALAARGMAPRLLLPAALATPGLLSAPAAFDGRIFIAYPTLPADVSATGREAFATLGSHGELPGTHVSSQIAAFAGAKVLIEAMQRTGRSLSRPRLVAELEGMSRFETGLTPPISYSLNRRVGALGAHILRVDLETGRIVPQTAWTNLQ